MDDTALLDTSAGFNIPRYHRNRLKQLASDSSMVIPVESSEHPSIDASVPREGDLHFAPSNPTHVEPVHNNPSTFESEFHVMDCDSTPGPLYSTRHRDSVSSSGSSLSVPASPAGSYATALVEPGKAPSQEGSDGEEGPWNLVAYHIPWGSSYEGYVAGTLPGPDGPCIFLRSPTPSKKQRTSQACEKCRERKAKCSGTRPSCARCDARGHTCIYTPVLAPQSPIGTSSLSSSVRLLRSPSLNDLGHLGTTRTYATSFSRKSSLPESVSSMSCDSAEDRGRGVTGSSGSRLQGSAYSEYNRWPQTLPCSSAHHIIPPPVYPTPAPHISSVAQSQEDGPPFAFSSLFRGSTHALSRSATPRHTNLRSGLDDYRFPPVESAKAVDIVHPQPQSFSSGNMSKLEQSHQQIGPVFGNFGSLEEGLAGVWDPGLPRTGPEMEIEYNTAASEESQSTTYYAGALHHRDLHSESTLSISSANGFFDSAYASFELSDPYHGKGGYPREMFYAGQQ